MRLVQFVIDNVQHLGAETRENGDIIKFPSNLPYKTTSELLNAGEAAWDEVRKIVAEARAEHIIPRETAKLLAPITRPDKVIAVGLNYMDHCLEQGLPAPKEPIIFNKFPSAIVGPYDNIVLPKITKAVDWEVELAVVIGKPGKNIKQSDAMSHVFGFTVANDVSARDWQLEHNGGQWLLGKTMDTFCPLGPAIVTIDDLKDPHRLNLTCSVNGVVKQSSNTKEIIYNTSFLIEWISRFSTLLPGDVILTGTPPGVGCFRKPPEYMKPGDRVECYIQNIGTIINNVVE
ncbi:Fumarylacetoacetate hydrolase domain-containing protein 2A [Chamberlinius hualienensis]